MPKTKPPYPEAFKQQIVEPHMTVRSPTELSGEFAVADAGKPARGKDVLNTAERDELARLRRRVRQLEQERDILAN